MTEKLASAAALLVCLVFVGAIIAGSATVAVVGIVTPLMMIAKLLGGS